MIKAEVYRKKNEITSIIVAGHSGYDELDRDIVCSAVSTAMFVSIGLLEKFNADYAFTSDESKPIMKLEIFKYQDSVNAILENLVETLQGITMDYSDYLQIIEK